MLKSLFAPSPRSLTRMSLSAIGLLTLIGGCASLPLERHQADNHVPLDTAVGDYLSGRYAASQQDYVIAATAFDGAAAQFADADVVASAFRFALVAGDFERATKHAASLLKQSDLPAEGEPGFIDTDLPKLTMAADALSRGDLDGAKTYLQSGFKSALGQSVAHLLEAWVVFGETGAEGAIVHLGAAPDNVFTGFSAFHMAMMLDIEGRYELAEPGYMQALQGTGTSLEAVAYALFAERSQPRDKAIEFYTKLTADRGAMRRVGRMGLARMGAPLPGETRTFAKVAAKAPTRIAKDTRSGASAALLSFAWAAYDQGMQRQQAAERAGFADLAVSLDIPLALAQMAAHLDDDLGAADYLVGAISGAYEKPDLAIRALKNVPATSWLYNYATIERADSLMLLDRNGDAIELMERYIRQDALAPDVMITLAQLRADEGDVQGAVDAATKAIAIAESLASATTHDDNLWTYHFARGAIHAEADDWPNAEKDLTLALQLSPDDPYLLNFLGYSYVERGENLDAAFDMIERALTALPTSGAITDSLGWAYYQRGEYEKAVEYLQRAVSLEPGDDTISDHLGDAYWQAGRQLEARFEWRRVVDMPHAEAKTLEGAKRKLNGEVPKPGAWAAPQPSNENTAP